MAAPEQKRWSQHVTETSDALSLEPEVFTLDDPVRIACSLSEIPPRKALGAKQNRFALRCRC